MGGKSWRTNYWKNLIVRPPKPGLHPLILVTIAVDTAYVAAQNGYNISQGVYIMDHMEANGSSGEGSMELRTNCPVSNLIGFIDVPINAQGPSGDRVFITGFTVEPPKDQSGVFTAVCQPVMQSSPGRIQKAGIGLSRRCKPERKPTKSKSR